MAEALACGTPVVARSRGSVPEIVTHGVTGLIGETNEEQARLCHEIHLIDRQTCRDEAVRRFSPAVMACGYEEVYCEETGDRSQESGGEGGVGRLMTEAV